MEDLGSININIRESVVGGAGGGRGGGGGSAGGGPGATPPPLPKSDAEKAATFWQTLGGMSTIGGELKGIAARPSVGGVASALDSESTLMTSLSALGPTAAALGPALVAGAVAIGAVVGALAGLQYAAKATAERIEAVGRYSGATAVAKAQEGIAGLMRDLREATVNGERYAEAQRAATAAADAWQPVLLVLRNLFARLSVIASQLSIVLANAVRVILSVIGSIASVMKQVLSYLPAGLVGATTGLGGAALVKLIELIAESVEEVADNTKPRRQANVNQWFMDDIRAMTGRAY